MRQNSPGSAKEQPRSSRKSIEKRTSVLASASDNSTVDFCSADLPSWSRLMAAFWLSDAPELPPDRVSPLQNVLLPPLSPRTCLGFIPNEELVSTAATVAPIIPGCSIGGGSKFTAATVGCGAGACAAGSSSGAAITPPPNAASSIASTASVSVFSRATRSVAAPFSICSSVSSVCTWSTLAACACIVCRIVSSPTPPPTPAAAETAPPSIIPPRCLYSAGDTNELGNELGATLAFAVSFALFTHHHCLVHKAI